MKHDSVTNIECYQSIELASLFLLQSDPDILGLDPLHTVHPYICHGRTSNSSMSAEAPIEKVRRNNDESKKRRLASNRASARRSRMRKQRHLDVLLSQVVHLHAMNQRLLVELNHIIAKHVHMLQENAQLREEASDLQKKLKEMGVEEARAEPITQVAA